MGIRQEANGEQTRRDGKTASYWDANQQNQTGVVRWQTLTYPFERWRAGPTDWLATGLKLSRNEAATQARVCSLPAFLVSRLPTPFICARDAAPDGVISHVDLRRSYDI